MAILFTVVKLELKLLRQTRTCVEHLESPLTLTLTLTLTRLVHFTAAARIMCYTPGDV